VEWKLSIDQCGVLPKADAVRQMVNLLIQERSNLDQGITVGKRRVLNFVRRHEALQARYNRKYDYQRAKCEDPTLIRNWV
jgi:hypothetical protein